tara:strand:- start:756 stop:977 length:222 start_codon:yes stop_codon:yes gene_type:complete
MKTTYGTYDYELSENNIVTAHYELYIQKESEDRLTPPITALEINKLVLNGDDVTDELECLIEKIESDIELNKL